MQESLVVCWWWKKSKFSPCTRVRSFLYGPSSLQDNLSSLPHPAGEFLESLHVHGVPCVQSDEDWSLELLDARMQEGCHRSATEHRDFIRGEMADFVRTGGCPDQRLRRSLLLLFWSKLGLRLFEDSDAKATQDFYHQQQSTAKLQTPTQLTTSRYCYQWQ